MQRLDRNEEVRGLIPLRSTTKTLVTGRCWGRVKTSPWRTGGTRGPEISAQNAAQNWVCMSGSDPRQV